MGGRSYHPRLGRFFSPDPLVVSPLDAQAYNRYSYVHNRPLVATDPTGYGTDLGADGGSGNSEGLSYHCEDERGCYRSIVVGSSPDNTSSLDQWNRTLQFIDGHNGPGQGGPGSGSANGYGNPYSANGVRHGTDAGQPGGTSAFTTEVTPDMCAEIAACSGRQSKQGPVYIWNAPIDDWARTAVDIATDFVPVVTHVKSAYDAYDRLQNGEDPVDVLMAAGGDALLGLIPGLKAGKKAVGKALDKVEDVADAAGDVGRTTKGGARAGEFSVSDWSDYPSGVPKPHGPFRLLEGVEYQAARDAANRANAALRAADPAKYMGKQIHEIHPVKFGGSPTDLANKAALPAGEHARYTTFWNRLMRDLK